MALPDTLDFISEAEYLAFERESDIKHEYVNGTVYAMSGAKRAHNLICTNIVRHYGTQLAQQGCEIYQSDMRVQVKATGSYRYPDVVIVCGEPTFADDESDTLLNPTILIEVTSPSTIAVDRGVKSWEYRHLPSLTDYLLIAQDDARIERYQRQADDRWLLSDTLGLNSQVELAALDCTLVLAQIYENVTFPTQDKNA